MEEKRNKRSQTDVNSQNNGKMSYYELEAKIALEMLYLSNNGWRSIYEEDLPDVQDNKDNDPSNEHPKGAR